MLKLLKFFIEKLLSIFEVQQQPRIESGTFNITINTTYTVNNNRIVKSHKKKKRGHVGDIKLYAGNEPPRGWFICDGQLLAIDKYPRLFSVIGTTYGGDGSTTFALPDLRGRTAVGVGKGDGLTHREIGETFGAERMTLRDDSVEILGTMWQPRDPGVRGLGESQGTIRDMQSTIIETQSPSIAINYIIRWKCN